jgi:chemotaxis protein CheZ
MLELPTRTAIAARLDELRGRYPQAEPEAVAEVVQIVLSTMRGTLTGVETTLLSEVEELGRSIANAKAEIAALKVDDITASHIPSATDELDAIVAHTAAATDSILEVCETLDRVGATLSGADAQALQDATTRIYEACSFQDITGQRITKVVAVLKTIEGKVANMLDTFGQQGGGERSGGPRAAVPADPDAVLLNGPQLPAAAMDQSDIDKLLASFD